VHDEKLAYILGFSRSFAIVHKFFSHFREMHGSALGFCTPLTPSLGTDDTGEPPAPLFALSQLFHGAINIAPPMACHR
jgi:hypothetical protein